jgi:hypothetical protein
MVFLGGRRGRRGIYLHDPPPGYHPPRSREPLKAQQRKLRQDYVLMRVATVIVVLLATAFLAMMLMIIATHL